MPIQNIVPGQKISAEQLEISRELRAEMSQWLN
jgi:hypothetical protein